MANGEVQTAWFLVALLGLAAFSYSVRVLFRGRTRYARVEKQGGSSLLSVEVLTGGYWVLQPIGRALAYLHVTPNMISWASLAFGGLAGACLSVGHFGFAAVFGLVSALTDALDGMVARLTGVSSDAGEVLDAAVDRYAEFFFFAGLIFYYREIPSLLMLTVLALIGSFMISYSSAKAEALQVEPPRGNMRRPERLACLLLGAGLSPISIEWFEKVREAPVAIAHPMVAALGVVAVFSNVSAVERLWVISRRVRERSRKDPRAA